MHIVNAAKYNSRFPISRFLDNDADSLTAARSQRLPIAASTTRLSPKSA
jgi:hypothetical protein